MRIVIAEDLFLLREGLVRLLSAHGFEIAAAVASAPELLEALVEQRPDVGIVDVRLPPTQTDDGLRAALQARAGQPARPRGARIPGFLIAGRTAKVIGGLQPRAATASVVRSARLGSTRLAAAMAAASGGYCGRGMATTRRPAAAAERMPFEESSIAA